MKSPTLRLLAAVGLLALAAAQAAPFVAPAEGPVPFRRDRLPLDPDSIATLSGQLVTLTASLDTAAAAQRRSAAQILALALALNPANRVARTTIESLENARQPAPAGPSELARAKARIWTTLAWLEDPEAGDDGQALAACLADVITATDPDHPRAKAIAAKGEQGAWNGWVAKLGAFEEKTVAVIPPPDEPMEPEDGEESPAEDDKPAFRLTETGLTTVLWALDPATKTTTLRAVPVDLKISTHPPDKDGKDSPFRIRIENTDDAPFDERLYTPILAALTSIHGALPDNTHATLTIAGGAEYRHSLNGSTLAGPAALLIHAAITGVPPDALVLGVIDETGGYRLSPHFWNHLRALENGPGGRLVLPAAAAELLPSLLALEKPDFFFKYEILLASNLAELAERAAGGPAPPTAAISAKFLEIHSRIGNQTVPQYVSNSFIRQRLAAIAQEAPHHFSSRMLVTQGAGERPTRLPRKVLAAELRAAIEPMSWLTRHEGDKIDDSALDRTYATCRATVDGLERYVDSNDRELHEEVRSLVIAIRTLAREARERVRPEETPPNIRRSVGNLAKAYETLRDQLTTTAGDGEITAKPPR